MENSIRKSDSTVRISFDNHRILKALSFATLKSQKKLTGECVELLLDKYEEKLVELPPEIQLQITANREGRIKA